MEIQPIKRQSVSEQVFEQLKQLLISGEWAQGVKLPSENELAASFGVSRVTVRQALQKLTALGLLETRLGEGSFVRRLDAAASINGLIPAAYLGGSTLIEVLEFRQAIDPKSAGLAARRAGGEDIARLEGIYRQMQESRADPARFAQADLDFHLCLAQVSRNPLLIETHSIVRDVLRVAMRQIVERSGFTAGLHYHGQLLEAVRRRDEQAAFQLMQQHVDDTLERMKQYMQEKPEGGD